jgi:hypothetical protein
MVGLNKHPADYTYYGSRLLAEEGEATRLQRYRGGEFLPITDFFNTHEILRQPSPRGSLLWRESGGKGSAYPKSASNTKKQDLEEN